MTDATQHDDNKWIPDSEYACDTPTERRMLRLLAADRRTIAEMTAAADLRGPRPVEARESEVP